MSHNRNVTIKSGNKLDLSGSSVTVTGSLFAPSLTINNSYSLPTTNGNSGQVISSDGTGQLVFTDVSAGSTPGGVDTSVQFNSGSTLSGSTDLTYDYTTGVLSGTIAEFTGVSSSYLALSSSTVPVQRAGTIFYDNTEDTLKQWTEISDVNIRLGQQSVVRVRNVSGVPLAKGKIVHITGSTQSDTPLVTTASWESDANCADTLGMLMQQLDNNETGYAIQNGLLRNINTNGFSVGDMIYLSSSGDFTNQPVISPFHEVRIGQVTRAASNGTIFVRVMNGYEIDELHDVLISGKQNGDLLSWDSGSLVWKNTKTLSGSYTVTGDITASNADFVNITADTITAREYHTELVSASIIYQSGSTKFGDTAGGVNQDTHQFSGSLYITGSNVTLTGGIFSGNGSGLTSLSAANITGTIDAATGGTGQTTYATGDMLYASSTTALSRRSIGATDYILTSNGSSPVWSQAVSQVNLSIQPNNTTYFLVSAEQENNQVLRRGNAYHSVNSSGQSTITANTFSGNLTGNASSATYATNISITEVTSNGSYYVPFMSNYTTTSSRALYGDGGIYYNPSSNTLTVGTLVETSTRDIKENIKSIPNQLSKLKKLNPVRYNKINSNRQEIGLIAEEVEDVYPEFVHEKGINYPKMVSVLISAVQELTSKVEKQQKEIASLKKKIK